MAKGLFLALYLKVELVVHLEEVRQGPGLLDVAQSRLARPETFGRAVVVVLRRGDLPVGADLHAGRSFDTSIFFLGRRGEGHCFSNN